MKSLVYPILSVADIELGDVGKPSCKTEPGNALTHDLEKWLANCDMGSMVNLKIPDIPAKVAPASADSAV